MLMATEPAPDASSPLFTHSRLGLAQFSALLAAIYEGPMESVPWGRALEMLRKQLDATYVSFILRSPASDRSGLAVHASEQGTSLEAEASYNSYYYAIDPFINLPTDRAVTVDEATGSGNWCHSEIYRQFLQPLDIRYLLGADIRTDDGVECRLRICRPHASRDFDEKDKAACGVILPHLKRAVRLHSRLDVVESERSLYAGAIDRMLVGMLILDESGAILKKNFEADEILAENDGIRLNGGNFEIAYAQESRKFQFLLRRARMGHHGGAPAIAEAMSITRPSGRGKLGVLIRTIPLSEWSEDNRHRPACAVFIRDPERKSRASHEVVRKLFDLTPAETALALVLADGLTLDEAAVELGISKNTARAHLRAIFSKTGVTRQATLVRTLLSSVVALG
ncbi:MULTISPECIES: helix-turn-helix transcriptional regulator [Cupriavidus]|uniref:Regulatory protein, LuxR n=1 Tax=Cupriavidus pinatubonensis (strain JMP 134 / LMG 1197) TaxID=264198 RepID=Q471L2_CUPPJ|nr:MULTISPECIES: helix-turn-helix transcriptional regulator [Cupriavidus]QYY33107.1 helix-turn-helix transcriptional regulator [Cupriavidus pinatubonensis]